MKPITRTLFPGEPSTPALTNTYTIFAQHHVFDACGIAKRFWHMAIFGAFNAPEPGEVIRLVNDYDPLPLLAQIDRHYGPRVDVGYIVCEPGSIVTDFTARAAGRMSAASAINADERVLWPAAIVDQIDITDV